jgi:hypothetical protein
MLVNRMIWTIKNGRMDEAVAIFKAEKERLAGRVPVRIYTPGIGAFNMLSVEHEFADLQAYTRFWQEWTGSPHYAETMTKFNDLALPDGRSEILWLAG